MPDVEKFFAVCSRLLKKDGIIVIYELHPFTNMIDIPEKDTDGAPKITLSYFNKAANIDNTSLDYYENTSYASLPQYWFAHKMSDIIMSMIKNGIKISFFEEYYHDISNQFKPLEKFQKMPLSYILIGSKD